MAAPPDAVPVGTPPDAPALLEACRQQYKRCDERAVRWKAWHFRLWAAALALTWLPLLLAVIGLAGWLPGQLAPRTLTGIITALGWLLLIVTGLQTGLLLRGRWLKNRAAAERLAEHRLRFFARLAPYDRGDAADAAAFGRFLAELRHNLRRSRGGAGRLFRYYLRVPVPPAPAGGPADGPGTTRFGTDLAADERRVVEGRLRDQWRWHHKKAAHYTRCYARLQGMIAVCAVVNGVWGYLGHRPFAVYAVASMVALGLAAYREFQDYSSLVLQFTRTAETLAELEGEYQTWQAAHPAAGRPQREARLRALAEAVESLLASQFRHWHFGADPSAPLDAPDLPAPPFLVAAPR